jgi:hypothetical protein
MGYGMIPLLLMTNLSEMDRKTLVTTQNMIVEW